MSQLTLVVRVFGPWARSTSHLVPSPLSIEMSVGDRNTHLTKDYRTNVAASLTLRRAGNASGGEDASGLN